MSSGKVDFFIVGQAKSGTSALANFLAQHPDICMANPKEPGYFAKDHIKESDDFHGREVYMKARSLEEYEKYFSVCESAKIKGEATTTYLYSKVAAKEIRDYNPEAKIIIMLRDPVPFLHSLHMQHTNDGSEDEKDFEEALRKELNRKQGQDLPERAPVPSHLFYLERAKYAEQIKRYQTLFPTKNILFLTLEDFQAANAEAYKKVLRFLKVDETFEPKFKAVNASAAPRSQKLHTLLNSVELKKTLYDKLGPNAYHKVKNIAAKAVMKEAARQPLDRSTERQLREILAEEVLRVSRMTGIDLVKKWGYDDYEPGAYGRLQSNLGILASAHYSRRDS